MIAEEVLAAVVAQHPDAAFVPELCIDHAHPPMSTTREDHDVQD